MKELLRKRKTYLQLLLTTILISLSLPSIALGQRINLIQIHLKENGEAIANLKGQLIPFKPINYTSYTLTFTASSEKQLNPTGNYHLKIQIRVGEHYSFLSFLDKIKNNSEPLIQLASQMFPLVLPLNIKLENYTFERTTATEGPLVTYGVFKANFTVRVLQNKSVNWKLKKIKVIKDDPKTATFEAYLEYGNVFKKVGEYLVTDVVPLFSTLTSVYKVIIKYPSNLAVTHVTPEPLKKGNATVVWIYYPMLKKTSYKIFFKKELHAEGGLNISDLAIPVAALSLIVIVVLFIKKSRWRIGFVKKRD